MRVQNLTDVVEVSSGSDFNCARRTNGTVACSGDGSQRQLGIDATTDSAVPLDIPGITTAVQIDCGDDFACARLASGEVACWGNNTDGTLGRGATPTTSHIAAPVPGLVDVTDLSAGGDHVCVVINGGGVRCWGNNAQGQIGIGVASGTDVLVPTAPTAPADGGVAMPPAIRVAAGGFHTCVTTATNEVWCWGDNLNGQLGDGSATDRSYPFPAAGADFAVLISAGEQHTCITDPGGSVKCWGDNAFGQIGDATTVDRRTPVASTFPPGILDIAAGAAQTCAIYANGARRCTGFNDSGQLGLGGPTSVTVLPPAPVSLPPITQIAATRQEPDLGHACAVTTTNDLYCWGENEFGQHGDGTFRTRISPELIPSFNGVAQAVAVGRGDTTSNFPSTCVLLNGDCSARARRYHGRAVHRNSEPRVAAHGEVADVADRRAGARHLQLVRRRAREVERLRFDAHAAGRHGRQAAPRKRASGRTRES